MIFLCNAACSTCILLSLLHNFLRDTSDFLLSLTIFWEVICFVSAWCFDDMQSPEEKQFSVGNVHARENHFFRCYLQLQLCPITQSYEQRKKMWCTICRADLCFISAWFLIVCNPHFSLGCVQLHGFVCPAWMTCAISLMALAFHGSLWKFFLLSYFLNRNPPVLLAVKLEGNSTHTHTQAKIVVCCYVVSAIQ